MSVLPVRLKPHDYHTVRVARLLGKELDRLKML